MGPIGSKVAYECVSRGRSPNKSIDSHCSISISTPVMNRVTGEKRKKKKKLKVWGCERGEGPWMTYALTHDMHMIYGTLRLDLMGPREIRERLFQRDNLLAKRNSKGQIYEFRLWQINR